MTRETKYLVDKIPNLEYPKCRVEINDPKLGRPVLKREEYYYVLSNVNPEYDLGGQTLEDLLHDLFWTPGDDETEWWTPIEECALPFVLHADSEELQNYLIDYVRYGKINVYYDNEKGCYYMYATEISSLYAIYMRGWDNMDGLPYTKDWRKVSFYENHIHSSAIDRYLYEKELASQSERMSYSPTSLNHFKVPNGIDYLPFQKAGIEYAMRRPSTLIADEMGCIGADEIIRVSRNKSGEEEHFTMRDLYYFYQYNKTLFSKGVYSWSYYEEGNNKTVVLNKISKVLYKGNKMTIKITTETGRELVLTPDHEVRTREGWVEAQYLLGKEIMLGGKPACIRCSRGKNVARTGNTIGYCGACRSDYQRTEVLSLAMSEHTRLVAEYPHTDGGHILRAALFEEVVKIEDHRIIDVYDLEMANPYRSFMINNFIVHNCGKTVQALGLVNQEEEKKDVLIVTLASLKLNWKREAHKWLVEDYNVEVINGSKRIDLKSGTVYVVNYDVLPFHPELAEKEWDYIIMDEAHMAKNGSAQRSKALFNIPAKRKIALTGTPIPNVPEEIYGLLKYLKPEMVGTHEEFMNRYCGGGKKGYSDMAGLNNLLRSEVMIRRLKKDVLAEMPEKFRQIIPIEGAEGLVAEEKEVIGKLDLSIASYEMALEELESGTDLYDTIRGSLQEAQIMRLSEMARMSRALGLAKIPHAIKAIRYALESSKKLVVFAVHTDVIKALEEEFKDICVVITGATSLGDRQAAVDRFQRDDEVRLFIGNIKAAGTGITLTAASHTIFVEFDWVPGLMLQAEDRNHRIGAKHNVLIQYMPFNGSLDVNKLNALDAKTAVQEVVLGDV